MKQIIIFYLYQMSLTSKRLNYIKFTEEGFNDYFSLVSKPSVMKYTTGLALTREQALAKFDKVIQDNNRFTEIGVFSIRNLETSAFIGLSKITFIEDDEAELGYSMLPKFWGVGYGTEMSTRMMELARSTPFLKRLMAIVDPENDASIKILTKHQFKLSEQTAMDGLPAHIYRMYLK